MPNIEIHYESGVDERVDLRTLGETCQKALAEIFNLLNQPEKPIVPGHVLVRCIKAGPYDLGIPQICIIIKCGKPNLPHGYIMRFCEAVKSAVGPMLRRHGINFDVEMFNTQSHGLCVDEQGNVTLTF